MPTLLVRVEIDGGEGIAGGFVVAGDGDEVGAVGGFVGGEDDGAEVAGFFGAEDGLDFDVADGDGDGEEVAGLYVDDGMSGGLGWLDGRYSSTARRGGFDDAARLALSLRFASWRVRVH